LQPVQELAATAAAAFIVVFFVFVFETEARQIFGIVMSLGFYLGSEIIRA
jgi:hypothetical protein